MTEEVVRAKRFELIDDNEDIRGGMEVTERGTVRMYLGLSNQSPGVELDVEENGTANIILRDERERVRSRLSYRSLEAEAGPGSVGLLFSDGNKDRAQLGVDPVLENPTMAMYDHEGNEMVSIAVTRTSGTALTISDKQGRPRAALVLTPDGIPRLVLLDKEGRSV